MKFISLGCNCSITYQLNKYNLREEAYPFDWSKISINQLISVLQNNFDLYSETISLKNISNKHFLFDKNKTHEFVKHSVTNEDNLEAQANKLRGDEDHKFANKTLVLKNFYNIVFAHEIDNIEDLHPLALRRSREPALRSSVPLELFNFKDSLNRRIIRFREADQIIFIRIELSPIEISYENNIKKLLELLNKYSNNYELRLIINSNIKFNFPNNVKIYRFTEFSEDWQMNHINWSEIFNVV